MTIHLLCNDRCALAAHRGVAIAVVEAVPGGACMANQIATYPLRNGCQSLGVTNVMDAQGKITGELPGLGK